MGKLRPLAEMQTKLMCAQGCCHILTSGATQHKDYQCDMKLFSKVEHHAG